MTAETSLAPEAVVGALLVNSQGEILLARFQKMDGQYVVPGGHVEYGETVAEALERELVEETGLRPLRSRFLCLGERIRPPLYKDGRRHVIYLDFVVEAWVGELQLDPAELRDGLWIDPRQALALPLALSTRRLIDFYLAHPDGAPGYVPGDRDGDPTRA